MANDSRLIMEDFKGGASPRSLFSKTPRLTLRQALNSITKTLPDSATVLFSPYQGSVTPDIFPFCGPEDAVNRDIAEPSHLCYQFFPAFHSLLIHRIKISEEKRSGLGTALIASQYPFWQQMGVTALAVKAHGLSEGFYQRLGFARAAALPECPGHDGTILTLMRLDLTDPGQKAAFHQALDRHPPETLARLTGARLTGGCLAL